MSTTCPPNGTLVMGLPSGRIYAMEAGAKCWIDSYPHFQACHYDYGLVVRMNDVDLASCPDGPTITGPPACPPTVNYPSCPPNWALVNGFCVSPDPPVVVHPPVGPPGLPPPPGQTTCPPGMVLQADGTCLPPQGPPIYLPPPPTGQVPNPVPPPLPLPPQPVPCGLDGVSPVGKLPFGPTVGIPVIQLFHDTASAAPGQSVDPGFGCQSNVDPIGGDQVCACGYCTEDSHGGGCVAGTGSIIYGCPPGKMPNVNARPNASNTGFLDPLCVPAPPSPSHEGRNLLIATAGVAVAVLLASRAPS